MNTPRKECLLVIFLDLLWFVGLRVRVCLWIASGMSMELCPGPKKTILVDVPRGLCRDGGEEASFIGCLEESGGVWRGQVKRYKKGNGRKGKERQRGGFEKKKRKERGDTKRIVMGQMMLRRNLSSYCYSRPVFFKDTSKQRS